jgi:signal transduction histidine kinase
MEMLLVKVVENAIEFSPTDKPVLIRALDVAEAGRLRISVSDEGPGIAEENREAIFESFRQIDAGHTRAHPGVGLGLSIAELIAAAHDTRIEVESTPGEGTTFSVEIAYAGSDSDDQPG